MRVLCGHTLAFDELLIREELPEIDGAFRVSIESKSPDCDDQCDGDGNLSKFPTAFR